MEDVANKMLRIAKDYDEAGDVSLPSLIRASGYVEHRQEIAVEHLVEALRRDPGRVREWEHYSEDKRTMGWCMSWEEGRHRWEVRDAGSGTLLGFEERDGIYACAVFILLETEWLMQPSRPRKKCRRVMSLLRLGISKEIPSPTG